MELTMSTGRPPLPREHGGWAMLLTPPVVALVAAGPDPLGLMAVLGWICAYCLRGPVEALRGTAPTGRAGLVQTAPAVARFWALIFGLVAILLLAPVVVRRPLSLAVLAAALVTLVVVLLLAERGKTRSITAGVLAVAGLMAGGPLYYVAVHGAVTREGWVLALACGAFFAGSVFRVKTLARERRSGSFRTLSVAVHAVAVAGFVAAVPLAGISPLVPLALAPALVWSVYGALRAGPAVNLAVIGKGEQWLTIIFGVLLMIALRV